MENKEDLMVGGYIFATHDDAETARNELKKISYLELHTDMSNMTLVKRLYDKALENRTFTTPIGLSYLNDLYKMLIAAGFSSDELQSIPLYTTFRRINLSDDKPIRRSMTRREKVEKELRMKYRNAVLIAGIMTALVAALLIVMFMGTTPNAINYKQAVTNEYASWEQELTQRENAVREKERELNISIDK